MPDRFGFDHFDGGIQPELRCIICGASGPPWDWPIGRREQHHRAHNGDAADARAEQNIEDARSELRAAAIGRRDRHVILPQRRCANPFCAVMFQPLRTTARFCSGRCKVAEHRRRHKGDAT